MKTLNDNKTNGFRIHLFGRKLLPVLAFVVLGTISGRAEDVFITGWKGTAANTTDYMPCPPSCVSGFATIGASNFSASEAEPQPIIPKSARRIHYGVTPGASWSLTPTDISVQATAGGPIYNFISLQNVGVYKIYLTKGQSLNASDTQQTCSYLAVVRAFQSACQNFRFRQEFPGIRLTCLAGFGYQCRSAVWPFPKGNDDDVRQ